MSLTFLVEGEARFIDPQAVVIAGFTGRDQDAVREHIDELRALGVPTPTTTPSYYAAPPSLVVQTDLLDTVLLETSGEAECVLICQGDRRWVTLGSDHTDREAETVDIALSKIVCQKPVASTAWSFESVADHVDELELRSWISTDSDAELYQEGTLGEFLSLDEILAGAPMAKRPESLVMFTGTLPAIGGIRPASRFQATLSDPRTGRVIELDYRIRATEVLQQPAH